MEIFIGPFEDPELRKARLLPIGLRLKTFLGEWCHPDLAPIMFAANSFPAAFKDILEWNDAHNAEKTVLLAKYRAKYLIIGET